MKEILKKILNTYYESTPPKESKIEKARLQSQIKKLSSIFPKEQLKVLIQIQDLESQIHKIEIEEVILFTLFHFNYFI